MASLLSKHKIFETNATLLLATSLVVVTIGGIVEIAPLFYLENTIEKVKHGNKGSGGMDLMSMLPLEVVSA